MRPGSCFGNDCNVQLNAASLGSSAAAAERWPNPTVPSTAGFSCKNAPHSLLLQFKCQRADQKRAVHTGQGSCNNGARALTARAHDGCKNAPRSLHELRNAQMKMDRRSSRHAAEPALLPKRRKHLGWRGPAAQLGADRRKRQCRRRGRRRRRKK